MPEKTHSTALVLIPPRAVWEPIQQIRRVHDRHFERWMPHATLVYPFRPRNEFGAAMPLVAAACARVEPFAVTLAEFRFFKHRHSFKAWLDPQPPDEVVRLQLELAREFPDCDDVNRFEDGFRPHLSVGQARTMNEINALLADLSGGWHPIEFEAAEVAMIWRGAKTSDVFRVAKAVRLGGAAGDGATSPSPPGPR
ncbi:MAG: 2'-5' RNA ligase family protein [Planctomycetota bacterium]|jgi:2'-5' RNA ligase